MTSNWSKKGIDNVVADGFSRFCEKSDLEYCASLDEDENITSYLCPDYGDGQVFDELASLELAPLDEESSSLPREIFTKISQIHNSVCGDHGVERTMLKLLRKGGEMGLYARAYKTLY